MVPFVITTRSKLHGFVDEQTVTIIAQTKRDAQEMAVADHRLRNELPNTVAVFVLRTSSLHPRQVAVLV